MNNRIRELRKERKLTLEELAKAINSNRGSLSRYELGEVELKQDMAKTIADFFGVSIDYLLGYAESRTNNMKDKNTFPNPDIDDFAFALYDETKELTEEQKQDIMDMVKKMKEIMKK